MSLDLPTLFVIAIFASTVAGLLLLLSWLQNRNVRALAWWAAAFIIGAAGVALIAVRGDIPDIWSIGIANAIIAAAYGIMWGGVRNFEGHPTSVPLMLAGAAIWLLACQVEAFFATPQARVALMSAIVFVYSAFSAWELWQGRDERLIWRLPIVVLLVVHAAFFIIRIPLAGALALPTGSGDIHVGWWIFIIFEAMFFSICTSYLLGGMAKERIILWYKHASLIDPLTGVGNRRAFLERGEKLLHRTASEQQPAVLLFFDLDKFKNVNDTFGHHVGDRLLTAFCGVATDALRPGDLFGRLGGEEFASLLPQTPLNEGLDLAERIRANFEATMLEVDANTLAATVSVGVAMSTDQNRDLAGLLMAADRALYRAKADGRNRVEYARAGPEVRIESVKAGTRESRRRWRSGAYDREASAPRITGQELRSPSAD